MVSASFHRTRRQWRLMCTSLVLACSVAAPCFGHGVTPALFSVEVHGSALTVATNFGVLSNTGGSWFNVCDEAVGGPVLRVWAMPGAAVSTPSGEFDAGAMRDSAPSDAAQGDSAPSDAAQGDSAPSDAAQGDAMHAGNGALPLAPASLAYTLNGLFAQSASDRCLFTPVSVQEGVYWQMDHGLPLRSSSVDNALATPGPQFALIVSSGSDANHLLRASPGEAFERIAFLGDGAGYRDLQAGGYPAAVYVTGYTLTPPQYKIAYSLDGGETLHEVTPALDPTAERLVPLAVDSYRPHFLYLTLAVESAPRAQLWRFDARSQALEMLFELDAGETLVGIAAAPNWLYLAATTDAAGVLYRAGVSPTFAVGDASVSDAARSVPSFEKLSTEALPTLACIAATETAVFLCSSDFSRGSPFLIAESQDLMHFEPRLRIQDLGVLASCGKACELTSNWLAALFGSVAFPPDLGPSSAARDAGEAGDASSGHGARTGGCDCRVLGHGPTGHRWWIPWLVGGWVLTRRGLRPQNA